MGDLIRREDALAAIVDERTHTLLQAWINVKKTVPSVDAVEVVRCKGCRKVREDGGHANCNGYLYCRKWKILVDEDGYCSWGERENDE